MKFMEKLSKFFGVIKVKTTGNQVRVTGIDGLVMKRYIQKIWATDVINKMMFSSITDTSFSFHEFFVPDIIYILTKLRHSEECGWSGKHSVDKIVEGLLTETWYKCSVGEVTPMIDDKRMKALKWKPMPKQLEFLHLFGDKMPRYDLRGYILAMAPGGGKAQPLDAMIQIEHGFIPMGSVKIGTEVVCPDGTLASVIGIHPQGRKSIYRITFEDGRSTECCKEHLWKIYSSFWDGDDTNWRVISLESISLLLRSGISKDSLYIDLPVPIESDDIVLPMDPYMMGILLGKEDNLETIDEIYFNGSPTQRLALLQGLMCASGRIRTARSISLVVPNINLVPQIQRLVRSLGGIAKVSRDVFTLSLRMPDPKLLFRLPDHRPQITLSNLEQEHLRLQVSKVEFVGEKEARCIEIDHPDHLYITDDYIVTHNTFTDLLVATCVIPPSVAEVKIVISPKKAIHLVWEKSVRQLFHKVPTYWCSDSGKPIPTSKCEYYIFNFEAIPRAIELANSLNSKNVRYFIIVDESHNFADPKSARTQQLVKLQTIRDDTYFIWTSGSPILKNGTELISFLECADPRFDEDAKRRFKRIFAAAPGRANEIFNHRLGHMMAFIVPKSAFSPTKPVVKELPVKLPPALANTFLMTTVKAEMRQFVQDRLHYYSGEMKPLRELVNHWLKYHQDTLTSSGQRREFEIYVKNIKVISKNPDVMLVNLLNDTRAYERTKLLPSLPPMERKKFRSALSAIKNIKLKVRGEALGTVLAKRRSECAAALAHYCKPEVILKESLSKTLFFASSVLPIKTLNDDLIRKGFKPLMVYGSTNSQLTQIMDQFENDPTINPVCATMQSLSEAVPVTAASTVVLLNRPFREATWSQVVSRADRLGQIYPVTVVEVTLDTGGEPNVSSTTDAILANVRELINEIVGSEFAGPDPDEREYQATIDASSEDPIILNTDIIMGL